MTAAQNITRFAHQLGWKAKDVVTGFEGIITARVQHMFGCSTYGIAPQELSADGSVKKTEYFDEARITITGNGLVAAGPHEDEFEKIFPLPLGKEARDKMTGFTGKITYRIEYLYGCNGYGLLPMVDKDGKSRDCEQFDEGRIEILGEGLDPADLQVKKRGALVNRDAPRL